MGDITRPTFEQAKLCPQCQVPGEDVSTVPAMSKSLPRGTTVHTIKCRTPECPWFDTTWLVQVNPDGSVPPPQDHTQTVKDMMGLPSMNEGHERILRSLRLQHEHELDPDKREIRRR